MRCEGIKKLLIPYLDSEISESQKLIVEAHLNSCEACQKEKELLEASWKLLDTAKAPKVSNNFTRDLMYKIYTQEQKSSVFKWQLPEFNFSFQSLAPSLATISIVVVIYFAFQTYSVKEVKLATKIVPAQKKNIQVAANIPVEPKVEVTQEVKPVEVAQVEKKEEIQVAVLDDEIIRNLEAYKNAELYQNYVVVNDMDATEKMSEGTV